MKIHLKQNNSIVKVFSDTGTTVTWRQLYHESARWAQWMKGTNIRRIGLCAGNTAVFLYAFTGALRAGIPIILVPVTWDKDIPACTLLQDQDNPHISRRDGTPFQDIQLPENGFYNVYDWKNGEMAVQLPTSGTSGERKWQEKSIDGFISSIELIGYRLVSLFPLRAYNCSPWFHHTGLVLLMLSLFGVSFTEITMDAFRPDKAAEALNRHTPHVWIGTPSMLYRVCLAAGDAACVPNILALTGEMITKPALEAFSRARGFRAAFCAYGTTEAGAVSNWFAEGEKRSFFIHLFGRILLSAHVIQNLYRVSDPEDGFAGDLLTHTEAIILDPDENGIGSIAVRTATSRIRTPEYVITGDIGRLTGRKLYITGRSGQIINHSGEKIDPRDIAEKLLSIDGIDEVAVFGIPSATHGEDVAAAVKGSIDEEKIQQFLPRLMRPRVIMKVREIPINESGKQDIRRLRETALEQITKRDICVKDDLQQKITIIDQAEW